MLFDAVDEFVAKSFLFMFNGATLRSVCAALRSMCVSFNNGFKFIIIICPKMYLMQHT